MGGVFGPTIDPHKDVARPNWNRSLTHPYVLLQAALPQHGLSRLLGAFAASRQPLLKRCIINAFAAAYRVDLAECEGDGPDDFESFNQFFTRALRPGARPLPADPHALTSPADGTVSQAGAVADGLLLQAKGRRYALADLLGDAGFAGSLRDGVFVTIYLAPPDYHRVHAPCAAELRSSLEIPGRLFSVNGLTERHLPRLFARNERLVLRLHGEFGEFALVLVGAMIVASIKAAWANGPTSPYRQLRARTAEDVRFARGDEVGAFLLGSTVIAVFPPAVTLDERIRPGAKVRMGERIGGCAT